jgi:hypothetical protein
VVEHLESRQLMAVDTATPMIPNAAPISDAPTHPVLATSETPSSKSLDAMSRSTLIPAAAIGESRSIDGTGNNLNNPHWGSAGQQLLRAAPADYADLISSPAGADRPSAREISNAIVAQDEDALPNDRQVSAFIYVWGQFIDHDIDLTEPPVTTREAFPVTVPSDDPLFDPEGTGTQVIRFDRSRYDPATGTGIDNPREQINQITAWIDGSVVYGSDQVTADRLRTFVGGTLRTSEGELPPTGETGNFLAGDTRVNENIELTAMHTLFIREHNGWAVRIAEQNPNLSDEEIYQQARAIVIAEIQVITFNEFLPALLGLDAIRPYSGYDPAVDPSVANEFSTAAFRMHTFINDDVEFFGNDGRAVHDEIALADAFNNPDLLRETGADSILKYLASTQAQEFDNQIVDSLRNFLFGQPGQGGFDLAALNIQRGRDHGLADYNSVREAYGLTRVHSFADITSDPQLQQSLESLYGSVDNIDLWVGGLAENHLPGSSVGELVQTIVADQFERLRDADRFWYENVFSREAIRQIESTSLAEIIVRNTTIDNLQKDVFFMRAEATGQVYIDNNGNGRRDRREQGIGGITVELLDDEGTVIATTATNSRGHYSLDAFRETGDFHVRIVVPRGYRATTSTTVDVLISRGDETVAGLNFGLRSIRIADAPRDRGPRPPGQPFAALDAAFTADESSSDQGNLDLLHAVLTPRSRAPR